MKNQFRNQFSVVLVGLSLLTSFTLTSGTSFAAQEDSAGVGIDPATVLPQEILQTITSYLPFKSLLQIGSTSKDWKHVETLQNHLDLREVFSSTDDPKSNFQRYFEKGAKFKGKSILLTSNDYHPDWIEYLPLNSLQNIYVQTTNGSIFSYSGSDPEFGHGWRDSNGRIWYGTAIETSKKVTYEAANQHCQNVDGGNLPTPQEFENLRTFLSQEFIGQLRLPRPEFSPQIIPGLSWKSQYWVQQTPGAENQIFQGNGRLMPVRMPLYQVICVK